MKAILCEKYGSPEVLSVREIETPAVKADEVLVQIHATTVNSADVRTRKLEAPGALKPVMRLVMGWNRPRNPVLGNIFAGKVITVGGNVTQFKAGDEVYGCTRGITFGCNAEYVSVREKDAVVRKPENASFEEAAAILFGGTAALYFLEKTAPQKGERILIYGASGAVGSAAVQIARISGLKISAFAGENSRKMVADLGAETFYDYRKTPLDSSLGRFDIIFDAVGKADPKKLKALSEKNGRFVTVGGMDVAKETKQQLNQLKEWFEKGQLLPLIDRVYTMEEVREAHTYVDLGQKQGNVVMKIVSEPKSVAEDSADSA